MEERKITYEIISIYKAHLIEEEKSRITIEKYIRDISHFLQFVGDATVTKNTVIDYKNHLAETGYKPRSVNSMLAAINSLFAFLNWQDCKVKSIKLQAQIYCPAEKELSRAEYMRLLKAAERKTQLYVIMQTICATGIRISELQYFTVEAVKQGEITVNCKGKTRTILIPFKLKSLLTDYAKKAGIKTGIIFRNKKGRPISRSTVWAQMKDLCKKAGVAASKVFPHNLRKLFARTFYNTEKDIAKLADILGHSNINTTRIYIISTGTEHRRKIERLGLVL